MLNQYYQEYIIRVIGRTSDVDDIGNSVIKVVNGLPVKIGDIAEIKIAPSVKIGDGSLKGKPAVIMTVMKQPSTNTLELTKKIDVSIDDLAKNLPDDIHINTNSPTNCCGNKSK